MGETTGISWTNSTWNPVRGCSKVSPGCKFCYAEKVAARFCGPGLPYEGLADPATGLWTGKVRLVPERLDDPLRWQKPRRIFVNSMSDLFHEALSNEDIAAVFGVMAAAQRHTFQVLTKRADRMRAWFRWIEQECAARLAAAPVRATPWKLTPRDHCIQMARRLDAIPKASLGGAYAGPWPLPNVWLGVSVEDQQRADERIPVLLDTPVAVRFLSVEPQLGPVDLRRWLGTVAEDLARKRQHPGTPFTGEGLGALARLHWVICGGESGGKARPFERAWATELLSQCRAAGVAFFMKQFGAFVVDRNDAGFQGNDMEHFPDGDCWDIRDLDAVEHDINGYREEYQGAPVRIRLRDRAGADPAEWPAALRVQQFPNSAGS